MEWRQIKPAPSVPIWLWSDAVFAVTQCTGQTGRFYRPAVLTVDTLKTKLQPPMVALIMLSRRRHRVILFRKNSLASVGGPNAACTWLFNPKKTFIHLRCIIRPDEAIVSVESQPKTPASGDLNRFWFAAPDVVDHAAWATGDFVLLYTVTVPYHSTGLIVSRCHTSYNVFFCFCKQHIGHKINQDHFLHQILPVRWGRGGWN